MGMEPIAIVIDSKIMEPITIVIDSKILFLTFHVLDYEFNVKSTPFFNSTLDINAQAVRNW